MKTLSSIDRIIRQALAEDLAGGDVTTNALVSRTHVSQAVIISKEDAVVCGLEIAKRVFRSLDPKISIKLLVQDGQKIKKNQKVLRIKGCTRTLLSAERVALNFLSYLSAIATTTNHFVAKTKPYSAQILDTRKTTPTLRTLERYAVRCGRGHNHRDNLHDMVMIKDNHLAMSDRSLRETVNTACKKTNVSVEIEVDTLSQFKEALSTRADIILLDNMTPAMIKKAVAMRNRLKSSVLLEASGGINLSNVRNYAKTGVDRISIGELTHSRRAIDFSMEIQHE